MAKKKETKKREQKYDPKLAIKGSFDEVIKASFAKSKDKNK